MNFTRPMPQDTPVAPAIHPMQTTAPHAEPEGIDWRTPLRRVRTAVRRQWLLIVSSAVIALALLVVYQWIFPPVYIADGVLQSELDQDIVRSTYYANWNVFRKGDSKSEPGLVTSGRVLQGVVKDLNLKYADVHHTFFKHITGLWVDSWVGKQYRGFKEWLFPPPPGAYKPTPEEIEFARTVDAFKDGISVDVLPGTTLARVSVKAPNTRAAEYANKLIDVYMAERARLFRAEAESAYTALDGEAKRAAEELAAVDKQRFEFDTTNKIVLDFEKDKLVVSSWSVMQGSINDLKAQIASLEASRGVIERQLASEPTELVSGKKLEGSRAKAILQTREVELTAALLQTRERYVADAPEVAQVERFLAETRALLKQEPAVVEVGQERIASPIHTELRQRLNGVLAQLASARATLAEKRAPLEALEKRMYQIPELVKTITELNRKRESLELRHKLLRERAMMADVSRSTVATTAPSVRVVDYAQPPMKASWPRNIILVPAALVAGLLVGLLVAVMREVFSARVNRDRLAARRELPVYAVIGLPSLSATAFAGSLARDARPAAERLRLAP
jgi:uncharacterized protein involved in exopolysaccharide biosynthesis